MLPACLAGCRPKQSAPRPRGYYRIDFPEKAYREYQGDCPYRFEYPVYGSVVKDQDILAEPCWINIRFNEYNGILHISYKKVSQNLSAYLEDSHALAYKHTVKADAINETVIAKQEERVYGILYDIKGNTATSVQFYLTDSTRHFLRGALYFKTRIDKDSLAPVIQFFREDVIHFINTFEWN
jgi:gliding motility-associated lipoprotein GldD